MEAGFPLTEDFSASRFVGFGRYDMNIWRGVRQSASRTHLKPASGRRNLYVMTGAGFEKVVLNRGRAVGVVLVHAGTRQRVAVTSEVIVCAGAVGSPHLLMHSGIGDPAILEPLGVPVSASSRNVGANPHDHLVASIKVECKQPVTLFGAMRFPSNVGVELQYLLSAWPPKCIRRLGDSRVSGQTVSPSASNTSLRFL